MNALIQLSEAKDKIVKLEADLETSLKIAEAYSLELKAVKSEYEAYKADAEKKLDLVAKEVAEKITDFEAKVEEKAAEKAAAITASVGVPPVSMTPSNAPSVKNQPEAKKSKGFKLVMESFEKELNKNK